MRYREIVEGIFMSRPNRFLAWVKIEGQDTLCHVKNTGRCKELLIPGAKVILEHHDNPGRKTAYSLVGVYKGEILFNVDSQAPNQVVWEWVTQREADGMFGKILHARREMTFGQSRFDLYLEAAKADEEEQAGRPEQPGLVRQTGDSPALQHAGCTCQDFCRRRRVFIEVKGVTLEKDKTARFPDAPTERGLKHVRELIRCLEEGYEACLLFVIQMKGIAQVEPNWDTHSAFGEALLEAQRAGVHILAYDCRVTPDSLQLDQPVAVRLDRKEAAGPDGVG